MVDDNGRRRRISTDGLMDARGCLSSSCESNNSGEVMKVNPADKKINCSTNYTANCTLQC